MTGLLRIARLHIALEGVEPAVWRRVEVPLQTSLKVLHEVIQAAMPFRNRHLFLFEVDGRRYTQPDPDGMFGQGMGLARNMRLAALVARGETGFRYTYDLGDDWSHAITIEAVDTVDDAPLYPRLVDGAGRAPPEDVGGVPGFETFREAMADPAHPLHPELVEWHGGPFPAAEPDRTTITVLMAALARRRALGQEGYLRSLALRIDQGGQDAGQEADSH